MTSARFCVNAHYGSLSCRRQRILFVRKSIKGDGLICILNLISFTFVVVLAIAIIYKKLFRNLRKLNNSNRSTTKIITFNAAIHTQQPLYILKRICSPKTGNLYNYNNNKNSGSGNNITKYNGIENENKQ